VSQEPGTLACPASCSLESVRGTGPPSDLRGRRRGRGAPGSDPPPRGTLRDAKQQLIERFERRFITEALAWHQGNVSKAAEDMGMYRQHLQVKLTEYGIDAEAFRGRRGER
jgi:DNA-binding NtrC family response regulator